MEGKHGRLIVEWNRPSLPTDTYTHKQQEYLGFYLDSLWNIRQKDRSQSQYKLGVYVVLLKITRKVSFSRMSEEPLSKVVKGRWTVISSDQLFFSTLIKQKDT